MADMATRVPDMGAMEMAENDAVDVGTNETDKVTEPDLAAEVEKWKALARKHEQVGIKARNEAAEYRKKVGELDSVKASSKTAEDRIAELEAKMAEAQAHNTKLETAAKRISIATKAGLTADDARFIQLGTEDEMTEAATLLAKRVARPPVGFDGGARGGSAKAPQTLGDVIRAAKRR